MTDRESIPSPSLTSGARKLLRQLLRENPRLKRILREADTDADVRIQLENWATKFLQDEPEAEAFRNGRMTGNNPFEKSSWPAIAAIRILDYIDNAGREFRDLNSQGQIVTNPFALLWQAVNHGTGAATPDFLEDMIHLFRQFSGADTQNVPSTGKVLEWMERYPSGLEDRVAEIRDQNRKRIIQTIIKKIGNGKISHPRFRFEPGMSDQDKLKLCRQWWNDPEFHLVFAVRDPDALNEMLDQSLSKKTMETLRDAEKAGIPFFVNPYYLSLLNVRPPEFAAAADLAIRDYVLYNQQLVEAFGNIVAWEKEDIVEPGKPNAAGWLLPSHHNIHRRYPDVAILIPGTRGRACGGLCASCQRMFGFQRGNLNFDLDKLKPEESWREKLNSLMGYFENDTQLRDILITGGDAFMNSDESMREILEAVRCMAERKHEANKSRPDGEKYAEIVRVRLGTRLPVYLPQRITPELTEILSRFREEASRIGIRQFVVQTHFESPMEVTPEARSAVSMLQKAGWLVTNQMVFTTAASRRGHAARLRQELNNIGVLTYYTFSVKGYLENKHSFATNARAIQEQIEEKRTGVIPEECWEELRKLAGTPEQIRANVTALKKKAHVPFLATDRNVLNLPGVGKSLTFRVIGLTPDGRRILEFDHDPTRKHSPVITQMGKITVIESKSVAEYLRQLGNIGEDRAEYESLWGYSIGETEPRASVYEYPEYDFEVTEKLTNIQT